MRNPYESPTTLNAAEWSFDRLCASLVGTGLVPLSTDSSMGFSVSRFKDQRTWLTTGYNTHICVMDAADRYITPPAALSIHDAMRSATDDGLSMPRWLRFFPAITVTLLLARNPLAVTISTVNNTPTEQVLGHWSLLALLDTERQQLHKYRGPTILGFAAVSYSVGLVKRLLR